MGKGNLVEATVIVPPGYDRAEFVESLGMKSLEVRRAAGITKDNSDVAVAMEVGKLVSCHNVSAVALAVGDPDFAHIARRLMALGQKCFFVVMDGHAQFLEKAFVAEGAELLHIARNENARQPLQKAVMEGWRGRLEPLTKDDLALLEEDIHYEQQNNLADVLLKLGYISSKQDPLGPALANFFSINSLGSITVWPLQLCLWEGVKKILRRNRLWIENSGDKTYIFPVKPGMVSEAQLVRYGTPECKHIVDGGGPFMTDSGKNLVKDTLMVLGYLGIARGDEGYEEAMDTFARDNVDTLEQLGMVPAPMLDLLSKEATLHTALVSSLHNGMWRSRT